VFTRTGTVAGSSAAVEKLENFPVFSAATRLVGFRRLGGGAELLPAGELGVGPFYAFCGIGNPRAFFQDLQNWKLRLADQSEFPDHHRYDARDATEIEDAARRAGAAALVTTEKDAQNLAGVQFAELPVYVAVIEFEIPKAEALLSLVRAKIESRVHAA
jgi:tetraacyldisaccharide 4'-kinase